MGNYAFDRENTRQLRIKLNIRTDKDIIEHIESIENKQGYIKQLIRADIAAHAAPQEETASYQGLADSHRQSI